MPFRTGLFVLGLLLLGGGQSPAAGSGGAYATGEYRNLFVEAGHPEAETKRKVEAAFHQLFQGSPADQALYFSAGGNSNGPLAYMLDVANRDVRSEGMSYGMMISVQLNQKPPFDALWNWAKTYMYHASSNHPASGFFSWSMRTNGVPNDEMPAPDGEEYFATALYFAANRWGNGEGIFNYRAEADRLLWQIKNRAQVTGQTVQGTKRGTSLFDPEHKMVRFTSDLQNAEHTDPSYHLPAFYELWSRWGPAPERKFWQEAAGASRDFFQRAAHPATGLCPEYANFDGSPWRASHNPGSADFRFDAWRTAMNWAVDWAWWAADPREKELSQRLLDFFERQGLATYANQYSLEGRPLSADHSTGLVAMNAVAALALPQAQARPFVEALWNTPIPSGRYRYYDGMLYLLGLLHCSGEFRIWAPESAKENHL